MTHKTAGGTGQRAFALSLPEELLLALLDEESGYFRQVPGWNLNCAMVGATLGELSLLDRIDTDLKSLTLMDATDTGHPLLDPILREIACGRSRPKRSHTMPATGLSGLLRSPSR